MPVAAKSKQEQTSYPLEIEEACDALRNLGYRQPDVSSAADYMSRNPQESTEKYLKLGLQFLMKKKLGG